MNDIVFAGRHLKTYTVPMHSHEEPEFIYCTEGSGHLTFESRPPVSYQKGDLMIVPPHLVHENRSKKGFMNYHVRIANPSFHIGEVFKIQDNETKHLLNAVSESFFYFISDLQNKGLLLSALGNLLIGYVAAESEQMRLNPVIASIRNDILLHMCDENYALQDFLQTIPFNYDYIRKLFKKEIGMTPLEYLTAMRMDMAKSLLSSANVNYYNISKVAEMCGFSEPLYFSRVFKKHFGISPLYYMRSPQAEEPALEAQQRN